jgi:hypothetical protein
MFRESGTQHLEWYKNYAEVTDYLEQEENTFLLISCVCVLTDPSQRTPVSVLIYQFKPS